MPSEEATIFRDIGIKITNLRAVFGSQTYAVSDIAAVETKSISASGCVPAGLVLFGLFLIVGGAVGDSADDIQVKAVIMTLGMLLLFGGILMAFIPESSYAVQISTTSGEIKAFTAFDTSYVDQIVSALNSAIIQQNAQPILPTSG